MSDSAATVQDLKSLVSQFCEERDWNQFHNPKDLAVGIVTEASELLEMFRFKNAEESIEFVERHRELVEDELSDALYFILRFAQMNGIDLSTALENKIEKNSVKYPVSKAKGCNKKCDEYRYARP